MVNKSALGGYDKKKKSKEINITEERFVLAQVKWFNGWLPLLCVSVGNKKNIIGRDCGGSKLRRGGGRQGRGGRRRRERRTTLAPFPGGTSHSVMKSSMGQFTFL